jgi:serine/threonine protein kinase
MRLEEGATIAGGRYTFESHLGSGGMASVWRASDATLQRTVAIKVMADILADDPRWLKRFKREARAAAALSHPQIVKVFDFGVEGHRPYLVMAYVPGGSLKEHLEAGERPDPERLARELLGALAHVHGANILHRDVKPGNILIDEDGSAHLTDFGIARATDGTSMTQTGMVMGTIRYLAPEVAAGEPATAASDLYAAGRVLRDVAGDYPAQQLGPLIDALTAEDPRDRPASAHQAVAILDGDESTTKVLPGRRRTTGARSAGPPLGERVKPLAADLDRTIRAPWFLPVATIAGLLLVALIVILLAGGGGGGGEAPRGAPELAPASAPLDEQLDGLDRAIDAAR